MADEYGLATLKPGELDVVTTAATTVSIPVVVGGIPKTITLANLITVIGASVGAEISFLDLADTPAAFVNGDTLKTSAVAVVSTTV
jgi:hypothetical protein